MCARSLAPPCVRVCARAHASSPVHFTCFKMLESSFQQQSPFICIFPRVICSPCKVLVLWFTPPLHLGGPGPAYQTETPAGQRATGRPSEGRPGGPQQHGQQLQPEGEGLMRPWTAASRPVRAGTLETAAGWSGGRSFSLTQNQILGALKNPNR